MTAREGDEVYPIFDDEDLLGAFNISESRRASAAATRTALRYMDEPVDTIAKAVRSVMLDEVEGNISRVSLLEAIAQLSTVLNSVLRIIGGDQATARKTVLDMWDNNQGGDPS